MSEPSNDDEPETNGNDASSDDPDTEAVALAPIPLGESEAIWGSREQDENTIHFSQVHDDEGDA